MHLSESWRESGAKSLNLNHSKRRELTLPEKEHEEDPRALDISRQIVLWEACKGWVYVLLSSVAALSVLGLCMLLSVSGALEFRTPAPSRYVLLREQGILLCAGIVLAIVLSRIGYDKLRHVAGIGLAVTCLLLVAVHVPGVAESANGASSWIALGPLTLQPSELAKLAVVGGGPFLLVPALRSRGRRPSTVRVAQPLAAYVWPFGAISLVVFVLVVLEPDVGTAIIIAGLALGLLWVAGMPWRVWMGLVGICGLGALGVVTFAGNRLARLTTFLHPDRDPLGTGFQLNQSLIALGRGGFFGVGPGQSVQKFAYLPQAHTDMIFSVIGEEFGFLGAISVVMLYALIAFACWRLARCCAEPTGRLLLAGGGMLIVVQAIINIGGATGILPLTGVPLPFISYGKNNLLVMLAALGIMMSVLRRAPAVATLGRRASKKKDQEDEVFSNVAYLDSWRRHSRARNTGAGRS